MKKFIVLLCLIWTFLGFAQPVFAGFSTAQPITETVSQNVQPPKAKLDEIVKKTYQFIEKVEQKKNNLLSKLRGRGEKKWVKWMFLGLTVVFLTLFIVLIMSDKLIPSVYAVLLSFATNISFIYFAVLFLIDKFR